MIIIRIGMNIHSVIWKGVWNVSETKRDLILDASLILFEKRGFDGTTVPMIVEKAGVGAGTLYRYFENKEALVNSLFQKCMNELLDAMKNGYPHSSNDVRKQFHHLLNSVITYSRDNRNAMLFLDAHANGYFLDEASRDAYKQFKEFLFAFIDQGKKKNIIRQLPADALIAIVAGTFIALCKAFQDGEMTETPELMVGIEDACWDAIRMN
ncbi:TetR/AcrR family transcriptional regulator [Brevibacillus reuszeri]|uniref:TetR/AcrR family transcriptional regulator n=1 Tax=Brevibacillus reuszeri TaxID=54915 RepID=UPI00289D34CD|nr:TetR/AcrR family transcriptional regulator [Brevibacillus reuszeri]